MSARGQHPAVIVDYLSVDAETLRWFDHLWAWGLLGVAAAGDAVNFWIVLQAANASLTSMVAMVLVMAMTAAAVALMHFAGTAMRDVKAGVAAHGRLPGIVAIAAWLAMGLSAFALRVSAPEAPASGGLFASAPAQPAHSTLWMGTLLLGLYLGGGVLAYLIGFMLRNPNRIQAMRARRAALRLQRRRGDVEARLASREAQLRQLDADIDADDQELSAERVQLRNLVRVELAAALGDPAATSGLLS